MMFKFSAPFTTSRSLTPPPMVVLFVRSKVNVSPGARLRSLLKVKVPGLLPGEIVLVPEPFTLPTTVPLPLRISPGDRVNPATADTSNVVPLPTRILPLVAIEPPESNLSVPVLMMVEPL